jgi:hypothetical protein
VEAVLPGESGSGQTASIKRRKELSATGGISSRPTARWRNIISLHGPVFITASRRSIGGPSFTAYIRINWLTTIREGINILFGRTIPDSISPMNWKRLLAFIAGSISQKLLTQNKYLKFEGCKKRSGLERLLTLKTLEDLVLQIARDNRTWGYKRIVGALDISGTRSYARQ